MQSYRPPRSAATAAEVAVNPPNLEELIQEASEVTQALSDRKQKAIVERWLSDLRPLVLGHETFQRPMDIGTIFVRDAVPLFPMLPMPLLMLLVATIRVIVEQRVQPLLREVASNPTAHKQVNDWAECIGRVLGGATNWTVKGDLSGKDLLLLGKVLLPTLCDILFDHTLAPLGLFHQEIIDLLSVLTEDADVLAHASSSTDDQPAPLSGEKLADLLHRFRTGPSSTFLDILDIAVRLVPRGPRESAERVAFAKSIYGRFRPDIASRAGTEMAKGKMSRWVSETRFKILPILAEESLDVMQPVQIVDLIETVDGVEKRQLRSESDQIAIGKGLRFALIDCNEIFVEGNIDGEGDALVLGFENLLEISVIEEGAANTNTVVRIRGDESDACFTLALSYSRLYDILSQRPISCDIPAPTLNLPASLRSSRAAEDLQLPDPGQQALIQVALDARKRDKDTLRRSAATEARAAVVNQTVQSDSTSSRKTSSTMSGSKVGVSQARSASARKHRVRPAVTPPPPPRPTAMRHVSELGSELSSASGQSAPSADKKQQSLKRKGRDQPKTPNSSDVEMIDETIVLDKDSPPWPSSPQKRARVSELSDDESMQEEPETWVPPKARSKPKTSYGKRAARARGKPNSAISEQSVKAVSSSLKSTNAPSVADNTWDDLPGAREVAKPVTKARRDTKARLKTTSPHPSTASKPKKRLATSTLKGKATSSGPEYADERGALDRGKTMRSVPIRQAAAQAQKEIMRGLSEEIEDASPRQGDDESDEIESFSPLVLSAAKKPARDKMAESGGEQWKNGRERRTAPDDEFVESPPVAETSAAPSQAENAGRAAGSPCTPHNLVARSKSVTAFDEDDKMKDSVDEADRMEEPPEQGDSSPALSGPNSYGNGMDYEPEVIASEPFQPAGEPTLESQVTSQSLGSPPAPVKRSAEFSPGVDSAGLRTLASRSRSISPAIHVYQDMPRLLSASQALSRPGALRMPLILSDVDVNKAAAKHFTCDDSSMVHPLADMPKGKSSLTPWKVQASKAAEAQEAHVSALEEQVQRQLEAEFVDPQDVFDQVPYMPDTYHPVKAGLRNTHSTPRALNRQLTAEKSFSEPPAEHLEPVLDIQPASDCAPSLPLWMQQRPHESRPKAGKPGSHAPAPDVSVPRNVRALSQPEFISAKSHFESTAESATVAIDVSAEGSKPPVHRPRKEPAFPSAGREDQTMRAVSGSAGRLTAGPAGSTRRGKTVSSPQSTGLSAGASRLQSQRALSDRPGQSPQAKILKKLLDSLNDELVDKVARRVNNTRNGARDAGLDYQTKLTALHRRFANENKVILARNDEADAVLTEELETIAGDLADLRTASKACADEVVALRERYRASNAAQQTALAEAMTGLRLMPRLS